MMKLRVQIKAFLLLAVFLMNTLAGFACSLGINMGYNKEHHQETRTEPAGDAHAHHHKAEAAPPAAAHHHGADATAARTPEKDCCAHEVNSFALLDKQVQQGPDLQAPPPQVPAAFFGAFLPANTIEKASHLPRFPFARSWLLSDHTAIRVLIQSFRI